MSQSEPETDPYWDDAAFRLRVSTLAAMQDRSVSEVCTTAGLANDYLFKPERRGRNIRAILALATSLKVPPSVLLFDTEPPTRADSSMLRRLALVAHVASHLYVSLDVNTRPTDLDIERIVRTILNLVEPAQAPPKSRKHSATAEKITD